MHRSFPRAAALLAALWLAAPAAAFTEDCPFGVNAHQSSADALDLAAAAGIGWVRFDMNWFQFEPSQDVYGWGAADSFITHADSLGLHVFVTIAYSPDWAVAGPCNNADPDDANWCLNRPPVNTADWTDFVTEAVGRYPQVQHWGLWNEPNLAHFWNAGRDQWVNDILIPGSDAVHAACPTCAVLGPELAHLRGADWDECEGICIPNTCECMFNGWNHSLKEVLADGGAYIDIVTHHKYTDPATEFWTETLDGEWIVIQLVDGVKEVTDQYAPGKPVWITEMGWETVPLGPHSDAYGASQLTDAFVYMDEVMTGSFALSTSDPWPELEKMFWYDLVDDPNAMTYGLLDASENPTDPYYAYQAVIQTLGDCTGDDDTGDDDASDDDASDDDASDDDGSDDDGSDDDASDDDASDDDGAGDDDEDPASGCTCSASGGRPAIGAAVLLVGLFRLRRPAFRETFH